MLTDGFLVDDEELILSGTDTEEDDSDVEGDELVSRVSFRSSSIRSL